MCGQRNIREQTKNLQFRNEGIAANFVLALT
jgi:hypothetical protein